MQLSDITVEVRDGTLARKGLIRPEDLDLKLQDFHCNVGTWTLQLFVGHPLVEVLRQPGSGIIITGPTGVMASGPTVTPTSSASTDDPAGTVIFDGVTDTVALADALAWPEPGNPNAETQLKSHDIRSGTAESVMHGYVNANIGPGAPIERRKTGLTMGVDQARGPVVKKSARFPVLGNLLGELATMADIGFRVAQDGSGISFQTYAVRDRTAEIRLDVRNGTLASQSVAISAPGVTHTIVAGQGDLVERTFLAASTPESIAAGTEWGRRIERFIDQRQTNDLVELQQAADEVLAEEGFSSVSVKVVPMDDYTMRFGVDWSLGDRVTVVVDGSEATSTVTGMAFVANAEGVRMGALIGNLADFNADAAMGQRVADNESRISALERNVASAVGIDPAFRESVSVAEYLPSDWVSGGDATVFLTAAFDEARARASVNGERRNGLPRVHIPSGTWGVSSTLVRDQERGMIISGNGMRSTILRVTAGIPVFEIHRSSEITIRDMTICCGQPFQPWLEGLIEGSTGVLVRERGDDPGVGSTTVVTFIGCEFVGLHKGLRFEGNQMGDNVTFEACKWVDNFIDLEHENGQSVNHRILGGEVLAWANASESEYNARLALWSAASTPVTARPGQLSDPTNAASPTQAVTVRDGAVLRSVAGGGVLWIETSFIARKTWLLLGGLPTDAAVAIDQHGTNANLMPYTFARCSGELRHNEAEHSLAGDSWGYERCTALRYERPHPASGDKTLRAIVDHSGGRYVQQAPSLDVLHLTNGVTALWRDGTKVIPESASATSSLVSLLTQASTAGDRGHFVGRDSTILSRRRVAKTPAGAAWDVTPLVVLDHLIRHEGALLASSSSAPVPEYDRSMAMGFPLPARRIVSRELDGSIIGSGARAAVGTTRALPVPAGALIARVGVSLLSYAGVAPADITLRFRGAVGTVYAELTARWSEVAGTLTFGANGSQLSPHRKAWATVETIADDTGALTVEVVSGTSSSSYVYGYIWAELL